MDAIEKAARLNPDAITMDIEMPRLDDLGALKRLMSENPKPVIMISSLTQEGADRTCAEKAIACHILSAVDCNRNFHGRSEGAAGYSSSPARRSPGGHRNRSAHAAGFHRALRAPARLAERHQSYRGDKRGKCRARTRFAGTCHMAHDALSNCIAVCCPTIEDTRKYASSPFCRCDDAFRTRGLRRPNDGRDSYWYGAMARKEWKQSRKRADALSDRTRLPVPFMECQGVALKWAF